MSPTPEETGPSFFEYMDPCLKARVECSRIIYESLEKAKAELGGNPVRFIGLILDGDCVHPVIKETRISEKWDPDSLMVENQIYALGGEGFSGLYDAFVGSGVDGGLGVKWAEDKNVYYRLSRWFSGEDTWLRICIEGEPVHKEGVIFFPREVVEKGYSVEGLLRRDRRAFITPEVFTALLGGLKKAAGIK